MAIAILCLDVVCQYTKLSVIEGSISAPLSGSLTLNNASSLGSMTISIMLRVMSDNNNSDVKNRSTERQRDGLMDRGYEAHHCIKRKYWSQMATAP